MSDDQRTPSERRVKTAEDFTKKVASKEGRRIKGKSSKDDTLLFGLGVVGVVGWSVVIPSLIFTALGLWIDRTWPSRFSWALMMLILGVALGCMNAWYWVKKARQDIMKE
jgi:ATP synthase protein I